MREIKARPPVVRLPVQNGMRRARGRGQMKHFQEQKNEPIKTSLARLILKSLERFQGVRLCTVITAVPVKAMSVALIQLRNGQMCTEVRKLWAF